MKKNVIIIIFILLLMIPVFSGEKQDIIHALKLTKLNEHIDMTEEQIVSYLMMEKGMREMNLKFGAEREKIIEKVKEIVESKKTESIEKIIRDIEHHEKARINEEWEIKNKFLKRLKDDQKLKYIIFEYNFRRQLRENLLMKKIKPGG
ncbi:hypothetical protein KAU15_02085 [candidate division WOR-3 bacterium]|nr:hypothetical protein [candidate division WOR-3 bacterium]